MTLGGFCVRKGDWLIDERQWARPIDARLVRFLVVRGEVPVTEEVILETFWPGRPPHRSRRSLQVSASRVRRVLDHPGTRSSAIEALHGSYRLRLAEGDTIDWKIFDVAAGAALARGRADRGQLERARALWGGEPMPRERYSDWALPWRERMVDRYLELLDTLGAVYESHAHHAGVISVAREAVELDPLDEVAHRRLMASLARAGRRGMALRQYLACRRVLADELGVEPATATSELRARIVAGADV